MENFDFENRTRIVFGRDSQKQVGELCVQYGRKILLHFGGQSIKKSGLYDEVCASLRAAGLVWVELGGVQPNPRLSLVREGIDLCRQAEVDLILAVGGGSVIDSAKAIALGAATERDVWDFYTGKAIPRAALKVATILTIPAAGSEASPSSVITNEEGWLKRGVSHNHNIRPVFSILNPELCFTLPAWQVACGAADIMAHLMERYFTNSLNTQLSDELLEATMRTLVAWVPQVSARPRDYDAWSQVMWCGTLAHNDLFGIDRVGDWASHDIEHELSGIYDVAHGAGLAVVFPAWMGQVHGHDLARFSRFATRVWGLDPASQPNPAALAKAGIAALRSFFTTIGLPVTLNGLKIPAERIPEMAQKACAKGRIGNFVPLDAGMVQGILEAAR